MTGCAANKVNRPVGFSCIVGISRKDSGETQSLSEVDKLKAICETGQAPGLAVRVKPYIIV